MQDKDFIRMLITPGLVIVGILAVLSIFHRTMTMMSTSGTGEGLTGEVMKEIAGVAGTATAMIGTLVSFVVGHNAGSAGKEKAEDRTHDAMNEKLIAERKVEALRGMMDDAKMKEAKEKHPGLFSSLGSQ